MTRILYEVKRNGMVTFPDQDPQPADSDLKKKIPAGSGSLYEADTVPVSVGRSFGLTYKGTVTSSLAGDIVTQLKAAWEGEISACVITMSDDLAMSPAVMTMFSDTLHTQLFLSTLFSENKMFLCKLRIILLFLFGWFSLSECIQSLWQLTILT